MGLFDKWAGRVAVFFDEVLLPDELHVTLLRARKAVEEAEYGEALRLLEELDGRKPGLARVRELQGMSRLGLEDYPGAAKLLRQAAIQRPDARTYRYMALALELGGDWRGAREALGKALGLGPEVEEGFHIHHSLGRVYLALRRPDKAIRELRKGLRILEGGGVEVVSEDALFEARVTLGRALLERDEVEEVEGLMEQVLPEGWRTQDCAGLSKVELDALHLYGRALLVRGEVHKAQEALGRVVAQRSQVVEVLLDAGQAAMEAGQFEEARGVLEQARERADDRTRPRVLTLLSEALLGLGDAEGALMVLDRVFQVKPDDPEGLRVSAWARLQQLPSYRERVGCSGAGSASQRPLDEDALSQVRVAEGQFARLRLREPGSPDALHGLGRCRMLRGDWSGARRFLGAAREAGAKGEALVDLALASLRAEGAAAAVVILTELRSVVDKPGQRAALTQLLQEAYDQLIPDLQLPAAGDRDVTVAFEAASRLRSWLARTPKLLPFLPEAQKILDALNAPLDVAFVGEFNVGKSTLVNAFIGEAVVPTGVLPTTAHVNVMRFGPRRTAQLHLKHGGLEEVAFPDVKRRVRADEDAIDHIEYLYPHPDLRRVHIWDTPGFNSPNANHEAHAQRALARAEAIFWVCDATQAMTNSEKSRIDTIVTPEERLVVVLNKIDRLGPDRQEAASNLEAHVRKALGDRCKGVFPVSAREGLNAQTNPGQAKLLKESGLDRLLEFAEHEVFDRAGRLKATVAGQTLRTLAKTIEAQGERLVSRYQKTAEHIDALREGLAAEETNFTEQLALQERDYLKDGVDFLLTLVAREIIEALQPSSRLIDALLTRMELEVEDVEFIIELLVKRFATLLDRSRDRVDKELIEVEQRFIDAVDAMADTLEPGDALMVRRRLEGYLSEARTLRRLLTQRVYAQYRLIAVGRTTSPGAERLIRRYAAARDLSEDNRKMALGRLLPKPTQAIEAELGAWAREYFDAARRFCHVLQGDLDVLVIEAQTIAKALADPSSPGSSREEPAHSEPKTC